MTIEFRSISKPMLEDIISHVEETLELTESNKDLMDYAGSTGRCRGALSNVLSVLRVYLDDEVFSLK
jgi:hypothetical protein